MNNAVKWSRIIAWLVVLAPIAFGYTGAQLSSLPIDASVRKSIFGRSYVLQLQNNSNEELDLWLSAKRRIQKFTLSAKSSKNFGWVQGFSFDANNRYAIWGVGYDTLRGVMPSVELELVKLSWSSDGGLSVSYSQAYLQEQVTDRIKVPIKRKALGVLEIELNQTPQIILKEGSNRFHFDATLQASILSSKVRIPIKIQASCIPFYQRANMEIAASQVRLDKIEVNLLPKEWLRTTEQFVNKIVPSIFEGMVLHKLDKNQKKGANLVGVRSVRVDDGRLEVLIF